LAAVRPYEEKDKENVREVCLATGPKDAYEPKKRAFLTLCFSDYYTEKEPDNCFVLADDSDEAVGYILCAQDYRRYAQVFRRDYLPRVRKLGFFLGAGAWVNVVLHGRYAKKYPAHLHIDILDAFQRQGYGSRLMDALTANLRKKGVPAVMLVVGSGNKKGRSFYKKYGFEEVRVLPGGVVMGLKLL